MQQDHKVKDRRQAAGEVFACRKIQPAMAFLINEESERVNAGELAVVAEAWVGALAVARDVRRWLTIRSPKRNRNRKGLEMMAVNDSNTSRMPAVDGGPLKIMLASGVAQRLAPLAAGLRTTAEAELCQAESMHEIMELLGKKSIELVIIDEELRDVKGIELARILAKKHPFVNCILVSELPAEEFHEETEGLGVLMQLPSPPGKETAQVILAHLSAIKATQVV